MANQPRQFRFLTDGLERGRWFRAGVASGAWAALLVLLPGCPPMGQTGVAPRDAREALRRVNDNLDRIREPLYCGPALVSFKFRDAQGRDHRFIGHPTTLIFRRPQSLYFNVKSLAGSVAQMGSNDKRYWIWVQPEVDKMWWGEWARLSTGAAAKLPIPPDQLLDVLMWRPLPENLPDGFKALLTTQIAPGGGCTGYSLLFCRVDDANWPYAARELKFNCQEPYQPNEIIDRKADGTVVLHASLESYARVGEDGPYIPRRYVVEWPQHGTEMRLDIDTAKFRPQQPDEVWDFPTDPPVREVEQIDKPTPARGVSRAARGETGGT